MNQEKGTVVGLQKRVAEESRSALDMILRQGAQRMLQAAVESEVADYIEGCRDLRDENGRRLVVRNGHLPEREVATGVGPVSVKKPRVDDRRVGHRFESNILPSYMRRSPTIEALIPALYLRGVSTSGFQGALEAILGKGAGGLSPASIVRLKECWEAEYREWSTRDLTGTRFVYIWADGIYFNVRLTKERPCVLILIGTTPDGRKELIGLLDGERESKLSWKELLLDVKRRGLEEGPQLAVADGGLGFWPALEEVFPDVQEQRCWVHKTANVLDKMAKSVQSTAKRKLHEMYLSATKEEALATYEDFLALYDDKFPKACECLRKDKDVLFTFYDFPAAHWQHLRTTNPIESTFATVRHRTRQTKGSGSRTATLTMVFKLALEAEKKWRRLNGYQLVVKVMNGTQFINGVEEKTERLAA
jgi:putative transposase